MPTNDGGPAFPTPMGPAFHVDGEGNRIGTWEWDEETGDSGMSLRDYFAGQALAGLMADPNAEGTPEAFARIAYQIADAMIAERNKEGTQ